MTVEHVGVFSNGGLPPLSFSFKNDHISMSSEGTVPVDYASTTRSLLRRSI